MKHRICVLDDEMFIADSLGKLLRQSFGEEAEVFVTYSAERAAETIRSKECDIALADIQMPGISGLEMLRRLRQENNQVQVVFLTGFDSFEYAYDAMQQEAAGYLLKTEEDEQVVETLRRLMKKIERRHELENTCLKTREQLNQLQPLIRRQALMDFLRGFEESGDRFEEATLMVLARSTSREEKPVENEMVLQAVSSILEPVLAGGTIEAVRLRRDLIWLVRSDAPEVQSEVFERLCNAQEALKPTFGQEWSFVMEPRPIPGRELRRQYELLRAYLTCQMVTEEGGVSILQNGWMASEYNARLEEQLHRLSGMAGFCQRYLEEGMRAEYEGAVHEICDFLENASPASSYESAALYMMVAAPLICLLRRTLPDGTENAGRLTQLCESNLQMDWGKKAKLLRTMAQEAFDDSERQRLNGLQGLILQVEHYVQSHLDEDLSLGKISQVFSYSPAHMARLFKQYTAVSLRDYVQDQRIRLALELLRSTSLKIYEITRRCGYENTAYFIRVFKSVTGVTPQEWRNGENRRF